MLYVLNISEVPPSDVEDDTPVGIPNDTDDEGDTPVGTEDPIDDPVDDPVDIEDPIDDEGDDPLGDTPLGTSPNAENPTDDPINTEEPSDTEDPTDAEDPDNTPVNDSINPPSTPIPPEPPTTTTTTGTGGGTGTGTGTGTTTTTTTTTGTTTTTTTTTTNINTETIDDSASPTSAPTSPTDDPADASTTSPTSAISDDATPQGMRFFAPGSAWALFNLICVVIGLLWSVVFLVSFLHKRREHEDERPNELEGTLAYRSLPGSFKSAPLTEANSSSPNSETAEAAKTHRKRLIAHLAVALISVLAFIVFTLTEDMSLPMAWVDRWSVLMAAILVIQALTSIFAVKAKKVRDKDESSLVPVPQPS
jgi:hypothetical protein